MPQNTNRTLSNDILQDDRDALTAILSFEDYAPVNATYQTASLTTKQTAMDAARAAELNAENALKAARDAARAVEWEFHNAMLGAKDQVKAQYGNDSDEVASVGLKKKSERKSPTRKPPATTTTSA